jgi:hypothetical protein
MLKITREQNGEVVFKVSGRLEVENMGDLEALFSSEPKRRPVVFDLLDLTLVDQAAIHFLESCEVEGVELRNCPAYIRQWITRERDHG